MTIFEPASRLPITCPHKLSPAPAPATSIGRSIADAWRCVAQRRIQARGNRRDVEALSQLDDHQLKDIGLARGQIESFVAERLKRSTSTR
jgi:uncharacterized protein YjiS (DUF1127 family)